MHSQEDQEKVLKFARRVLEESYRNKSGKISQEEIDRLMPKYSLENNVSSCVFATLRKSDRLRGCVGTLLPGPNLLSTVAHSILQAATCDPRFDPLSEDELDEVTIEISILSEMRRIKNPNEIIPNVHGVLVKRGLNSGLFLPQVWKQIPSKNLFLSELCASKAGLAPDAWKDKSTEVYIFTVEMMEES